MRITRILLILTGTFLLAMTATSDALAEDHAPDFSYFEDPNTALPSKSKSRTEAEPPCITCNEQLPKIKGQQDLKKAVQKVQKASPPVAKKKVEEPCITCGRVSLEDVPVKTPEKKPVVGQNLWDQFPQIAAYSESTQVKNMIRYAERHSYSKSQGMCYRHVKQALCGASRPRCKSGSMVSGYLNGNPVFADLASKIPKSKRLGVNAIKTMKDEGFINLLDNPETSALIQNPATAPKGAILIYTGGNSGGHIEIKTGHGTTGSYISDFKAPDSVMKNELAGRASRRYKLVAVMIKPAEKL